jgi:hypothetical protein
MPLLLAPSGTTHGWGSSTPVGRIPFSNARGMIRAPSARRMRSAYALSEDEPSPVRALGALRRGGRFLPCEESGAASSVGGFASGGGEGGGAGTEGGASRGGGAEAGGGIAGEGGATSTGGLVGTAAAGAEGGVGAGGAWLAGGEGGRAGMGMNSPGRHVWGILRIAGSLRNRSAWPHDRQIRVPRANSPRDRRESVPPPIDPVLMSFTQTKSLAPQLTHAGATVGTFPPSSGGVPVKRVTRPGPVAPYPFEGLPERNDHVDRCR